LKFLKEGLHTQNGQSDRIYKKGYIQRNTIKIITFLLMKCFIFQNIQNKLVSTHSLCKKDFKLVMEMYNNKRKTQNI